MALHLIKLCVGAESIDDLHAWIERRLADKRRRREAVEHIHVTRMTPQRREEVLDGGSLYWVIKGRVQVRQRLLDLRPLVDAEGVPRCGLVLEPALHPTEWQPKRPFQGWRYLKPEDAPADLGQRADDDLPPALRAELAGLGLI